MSDTEKGAWQNTLDGSYINVHNVKMLDVSYSDEGCSLIHYMSMNELLRNYRYCYAVKPAPVIDDTFNDDMVAQTFGGIQRDMGTQDKSEAILVTACSKCGSTVPADSVDKPALSRWAARFLKAVKGIEVSE